MIEYIDNLIVIYLIGFIWFYSYFYIANKLYEIRRNGRRANKENER